MAGPQDREPELACQGMDSLQKNQEGLQASGGTDDRQERVCSRAISLHRRWPALNSTNQATADQTPPAVDRDFHWTLILC
ncbi:hypothetical protein SKAU_G00097520 [Synaphobranchus kaupii]|uniref:Uncharacterized protein n=1 Tax=Synaphobranchus kaupii TaxID=118154 RepID=A0A9Q1J6T4_SYNKA|nr:hypothetical protein SKAU_G00097520 [Synaphobranchus kaupii]